ncbi:MAG: TatD family hydrolase [Chlorobium sp.]|uniref:TatD family hydrolase n=1 Tax=Chlorobium sp. TaxID=1095 RepID=UPI0025BA247C|nr:TatD family hydrolase [Chlorobium sp.]MCF8216299.1 TatD family hydrolase [Chlorobium sp.]MCF8271201.1 TatD family hydrolase [Chlorobium sp.]MCF8287535.1 TatD family hydrolase [Chlorobium sp.]MCF8291114.1 TatD family hydrolase [Chlorobium sp.]MCF8385169.1 TatD family hydrolase [Chlorobium sp.]
MYVDVHCHLSFPEYDQDRDAIISEMTSAGVTLLIDPGIDVETSRKSIELASAHPMIYANVGLHPHETSNALPADIYEKLAFLASSPKVVAIGEIGLDYHYPDFDRQRQKNAFRTMLRLAKNLDLPAVIHCREAWEDLLVILKEEKHSSLRGIMHCFSGDTETARHCIALGFALSIPGTLTYKRSTLPEVVRNIPIEHLLTETDSPYLSPVPFRGKRNHPANVRLVMAAVALIKNMTIEKSAMRIIENAEKIFSITT